MDTSITLTAKVMTIFLLVTSILVVIARGLTKAFISRSISLDDPLIALSLVSKKRAHLQRRMEALILHACYFQLFVIGQSVAVFLQTEHGYGMPYKTLESSSLSSELKVCVTTLEFVYST